MTRPAEPFGSLDDYIESLTSVSWWVLTYVNTLDEITSDPEASGRLLGEGAVTWATLPLGGPLMKGAQQTGRFLRSTSALGKITDKLEDTLGTASKYGTSGKAAKGALSLFDNKAGGWILGEGADQAAIRARIAAMEGDFFRLGGSYKPLSSNSRYWGKTGWVNGKPVIRLADDASYAAIPGEGRGRGFCGVSAQMIC